MNNLDSLKQFATIVLLGMLLFNWYGYQLLNAYLESRANNQLESKLDNNRYDESALISIKVSAVHISSYNNNSSAFKRVDGQIKIGRLQYNYVKSRLYNDSIEMLCIPNHRATHLEKAKIDFFTLVNDLQHNNREKKTDAHSLKICSDEYCNVNEPLLITNIYRSIYKKTTGYSEKLPVISSSANEHPPQKTS